LLPSGFANQPIFREAHNNLGLLLAKLGRVDDAELNLRTACKLKPHFPEAFNNLGGLLRGRGCLDEVEACCREALRLKPDYPSAQLNLGTRFVKSGASKKRRLVTTSYSRAT
jgi:Flp pilus assembly protein TadD